MPMRSGFTLIELLVVVTIIVVLLALLTPALDKAIYQAELTACGANFKALTLGTSIYAIANKKYYPRRLLERNWSPNRICANGLGGTADDRPVFRSYLSMNAMFNDPLISPKLNFETTASIPTIYSDPELYFNFALTGEQMMRKIGDRWSTTDLHTNKLVLLDVMVCDQDQVISDMGSSPQSPGWATSSHPDLDGYMVARRNQDVPLQTGSGLPASTDADGLNPPATYGYWLNSHNGYKRSPVDYNFGFQDGSVARFMQVEFDDERLVRAELLAPKGDTATYELVPER